jgi:hypothetical protein
MVDWKLFLRVLPLYRPSISLVNCTSVLPASKVPSVAQPAAQARSSVQISLGMEVHVHRRTCVTVNDGFLLPSPCGNVTKHSNTSEEELHESLSSNVVQVYAPNPLQDATLVRTLMKCESAHQSPSTREESLTEKNLGVSTSHESPYLTSEANRLNMCSGSLCVCAKLVAESRLCSGGGWTRCTCGPFIAVSVREWYTR